MVALIAAFVVPGALIWAAVAITREIAAARAAAERGRTLQLLQLFATGIAAADANPRALLVWQPIAQAARRLFPEDCAALDRAAGGAFPFSRDRFQSAHAAWTTEWLAWERAHDAEYKLKAAAAEQEPGASGGSAVARARIDAIEREKLERYQRRYEEYIRVAKALQALAQNSEAP